MRTVLVVDDEPDIREVVAASLRHVGGWDVLTATGGAEALLTAQEHQPDAVVLDVMMPGMDGPETARRLAADPRTAHIPVVLLTAKVLGTDRAALDRAPVRAVLGKPFDPMTLPGRLAEAVGW